MSRRLALSSLSAVVAAALSPWTSSKAPLGIGLAELAACVFAWEASVTLCRWAAARNRSLAAFGPSPMGLAALVVTASVPATVAMLAVFALLDHRTASPLAVYGQSLALGLVIAFARRGLFGGRGVATSDEPAAPSCPVPPPPEPARVVGAFLNRHAPLLGHRRLLALEAEDHYLRLHTDGGTALVLMRLTDAVAALGPEAGWRPHRSFWLAAGTPAKAERSGQGWKLTLSTGLVVPVSRANIGGLRAAGYREGPPA